MSLAPPRILIVEDDDPIRSLIQAALNRRAPMTIDTARDGIEAAERLAGADYAVVLIDLMMPRMNGFELLEMIVANPPAKRPVVFVMTAFNDLHGRELDGGVVHGIIRKPFDLNVLVDLVSDCALQYGSASGSPIARGPMTELVC